MLRLLAALMIALPVPSLGQTEGCWLTIAGSDSRIVIAVDGWARLPAAGIVEDTVFQLRCGSLPPKQISLHELVLSGPADNDRKADLGPFLAQLSSADSKKQKELAPDFHFQLAEKLLVEGKADTFGGSPLETSELEDAELGGSVSQALDRFSSVTVERSLGRRDQVSIRGAESRMVATRLEGDRVPSATGSDRTAGLAAIPIELIGEVAVQTTFQPVNDSDAIGGAVNLVTVAPGSDSHRFRSSAGAHELDDTGIYSISGEVARVFDKGQTALAGRGVAGSAGTGADALEWRFDQEELERSDLRDYEFERRNAGASMTLDSNLSESTTLSMRALSTHDRTREFRRRLKIDFGEGESEREMKDSTYSTRLDQTSIELSSLLSKRWEVGLRLSRLSTLFSEPDRLDTSFVTPLALEDAEVGLPVFSELGAETNWADDETWLTGVRLAKALFRGQLEMGIKISKKTRQQDTNTVLYSAEETLQDVEGDFSVGHQVFGERYDLGLIPTIHAGRRLLGTGLVHGARSFEEDAGDFRAEEATAAGFLQLTMPIGDWGELMGGLRYEHAKAEYVGNVVVAGGDDDELVLAPSPGSRSFGELLPMATLVAREGPFEIRVSAGGSFARPNYIDLVPFTLFDFEDEEIERGNPGLESTLAWNLDSSVEYSWSPESKARLGLFWKGLDGYIFTRISEEEINGALFEQRRPENALSATLRGVELSLRQTLMGDRSHGLSLQVEASLFDSTAEIPGRREFVRLPGQSDGVATIGLVYRRERFHLGGFAKHVDSTLVEVGETRAEDLYLESRTGLDLTFGYELMPDWTLSVQARDLTGQTSNYRVGRGLPRRSEFSGHSFQVGLTFEF